MFIPSFMMSLALFFSALALYALWQSLRPIFRGRALDLSDASMEMPERAALLDEKQALLRSIADLDFDRGMAKIGDEDFERLNTEYRTRAKIVLQTLDHDLAPYVAEATRLLDAELEAPVAKSRSRADSPKGPSSDSSESSSKAKGGTKNSAKKNAPHEPAPNEEEKLVCSECDTKNDADARHCKGCAARLQSVECQGCGTVNDPDAKFCKQCAQSLSAVTGSAEKKPATASDSQEDDSESGDSENSDSETGAEVSV